MCCKYLSIFQSNLHTFGSIEFIVSGLEPLKAINNVKNQERHGQIRSQSVPRNEPQLAIELTPVNKKKIRTSREAQRREPRSVRKGFKNKSKEIGYLFFEPFPRRNVPREVSCHVQKNIGEPTFGFKLGMFSN